MRKIIIALLLILVFAIPTYADVYWVDESQQNTINSSMIFYSPFGNPPMTGTPEFSNPMMGQTFSIPYQYPTNLYYQQQFYNSYPYYQMYRNNNSRNRNCQNFYRNCNPINYNYNQNCQPNWNNNQWNQNAQRQSYNNRNCQPNGNNNQQNQNDQRQCYNNSYQNNNGESNRNCYGMSPDWYQPYSYDQPRNWDYYQKIYEQWNQNRNTNGENAEQNPNMQSTDYQKWLEEHGNWYNPQGTDNEEQVSDKDNQSKEKEKSKEKESNKEQSCNKNEKK